MRPKPPFVCVYLRVPSCAWSGGDGRLQPRRGAKGGQRRGGGRGRSGKRNIFFLFHGHIYRQWRHLYGCCSDASYPFLYYCICTCSRCILFNRWFLIEHSFSHSFPWRFVDAVCFTRVRLFRWAGESLNTFSRWEKEHRSLWLHKSVSSFKSIGPNTTENMKQSVSVPCCSAFVVYILFLDYYLPLFFFFFLSLNYLYFSLSLASCMFSSVQENISQPFKKKRFVKFIKTVAL